MVGTRVRAGSATRTLRLATTVFGCLLAVGVASNAEAQSFELTPFAGWRFGGGFSDLETGAGVDLDDGLSYGLILGIPWNAQHRSRLELIWSWQSSAVGVTDAADPGFDLDVHYLHLSGMVPFATRNPKLDTLLSLGAGATLMLPDIDGAGSEVRFSASAALGLLYHVSDRVGIRLEARGWFTFTDADAGVFCSGGCAIAFSGSGFVQGELSAGLQLGF